AKDALDAAEIRGAREEARGAVDVEGGGGDRRGADGGGAVSSGGEGVSALDVLRREGHLQGGRGLPALSPQRDGGGIAEAAPLRRPDLGHSSGARLLTVGADEAANSPLRSSTRASADGAAEAAMQQTAGGYAVRS